MCKFFAHCFFIYKALSENNMQLLFDTLKVKKYPINRKSEKQCWKELRERLSVARSQKSIDVLKTVLDSIVTYKDFIEKGNRNI